MIKPTITKKWLTGVLLLTLIIAMSLHVQAQERGIEDIVLEGIQFHDEGRYDDAIRRYHPAFAIDSTSSLVHYQIAFAWYMKKDFENVLHHGREALKYAPDDDSYALAVNLTGAALDNSGDVEGAVQLYEEAIDRVPELHLLHYNLGVSAQKLQDFTKAENAYINSIYLNSDHASSHLQLGLLHTDLGNKVQILKMASELSNENEGLWWEFYVPLFGEISGSPYFEFFCNYIQFSRGESERLDWLHEREEELDEFFNWLVSLWEE